MIKLWSFFTAGLKTLINLTILVLVITFGVNNSQTITVDLSPTPFSMDIPVYLLFFTAIIMGVVMGTLTSWQQRKNRDKKKHA